MPLAIVKAKQGLFREAEWNSFANSLRHILVRALNAPEDGGNLGVEEIEVEYREVHRRDVNASDLGITVIANEYPSRRGNLEERTNLIVGGINGVLPQVVRNKIRSGGTDPFVWVLLSPAAFVQF